MGRACSPARRSGPARSSKCVPSSYSGIHGTEVPGRDPDKYIFAWDRAGDVAAVAFRFGSLYNHSVDPNAVFARQARQGDRVPGQEDIQTGEQIFVDYEWSPADFHFPTKPTGERAA